MKRTGFSFVEIMFAVVLLGIGFILLAAVFPVGIRQQQDTLDADTAGAMLNSAVAQMAMYYSADTLAPLPAAPVPTDLTYDTRYGGGFAGSRISASDPRFGWAMVWQTANTASPPAPGSQFSLYTFILKSRRQATYTPAMTTYGLQPVLVSVVSVDYVPTGSTIKFPPASPTELGAQVAEAGAFVLIASSTTPNMAGKIFRLSSRVTPGDNTAWYLSPDFGATSADILPNTGTHLAYMVGKELTDPTQPYNYTTNPYVADGQAQDVAISKRVVTIP